MVLPSCVVVDEPPGQAGSSSGRGGGAAPYYGEPLTAETGDGRVTVREGNRVLATIRAAKPNVEQTRWYSEQEQIVVKSRGNHGPATVELFESRTGRRLGSVMAFEAAGGPPWASPLAE